MASASLRTRNGDEIAAALRRCKDAFLPVLVASFLINLLMFVVPLYMLQVYDRVLTTRSMDTLIMLSIMAFLALICYAVLEFIRSRLLVRAGIKLDTILNSRVFTAVFRGSVRRPGQATGGQSLRDLDSLREFLTSGGLIAFCDAPWVPIFIAVTFLFHPWFGWMTLAGAIIILALALANELITRGALGRASQASVTANVFANVSLRNAEVAGSMGMMRGIERRWVGYHLNSLNLQAIASDRAGFIVAATKFLRIGLQVAVLGIGAFLAVRHEISPGAMIAASIIMGRALAPIDMAVGQWKNFVNTRTAYGRLNQLLQATPADEQRIALPAPRGQLVVKGAIAAPPGAREAVLRGISFELQPGESLGVVGPSAAGKSTLARVLVGIWPVAQGEIRLDGSEIAHWNPDDLGPHIGYLPQDVELFDGTVAENIARFEDRFESEAVIAAAMKARVHAMIAQLPDGYNTQIGAGGQVLSGGQRQRIALARALYGNPAFLVLDEPNSNLDAEGEHALIQALQDVRREGKTVVVITHKTSLLAVVDRVIVLKSGTVEMIGNRDEVLGRLIRPAIVNAPQQAVKA